MAEARAIRTKRQGSGGSARRAVREARGAQSRVQCTRRHAPPRPGRPGQKRQPAAGPAHSIIIPAVLLRLQHHHVASERVSESCGSDRGNALWTPAAPTCRLFVKNTRNKKIVGWKKKTVVRVARGRIDKAAQEKGSQLSPWAGRRGASRRIAGRRGFDSKITLLRDPLVVKESAQAGAEF